MVNSEIDYARRMILDAWEQLETANTWEAISELSDRIKWWRAELERLKQEHRLS
jgi:hypothetical protein